VRVTMRQTLSMLDGRSEPTRGGTERDQPTSADVEAAVVVRAEDRLRRLQLVSLELTAAVSIEHVVAFVLDVLDVPFAAPSRSLWLRTAGADHLELAGFRGMPDAAAERFRRIPLSVDAPGALAARERRTIVSAAPADAVSRFESLRDVPRSTTGFAAIPLLDGEWCIGVLGIGFDETPDERELAFFEAVAAQVAHTIVRIRLTARDRRRRAELEFLAKLTDTALAATDHMDLMRRACAGAVPTLGDFCALHYLPEDGGPALVAFSHVDAAKTDFVQALLTRYPYDPARRLGAPAVIRSGRTQFVPHLSPQIIDDLIAASEIDPDEARSILDHLAVTSAITVPLRTKRRVVGAMQFLSAESGRHYDPDDVALCEAVAGRLAEALDAAWLADQHRNIAVTLQQALLPPRLPTVPGLDIAARYWAAGVSAVGGDFYDVFAIGDRQWALLIGDVCGTGPDAAALTSIARHTVRAAARHGYSAAEVMTWLNEAVLRSDRHLFCTACYATLTGRADGWHLVSTVAGHPLPIISAPDMSYGVGRPGTLLGAFDQITTTTSEAQLQSGDVLVLYTDGITDLPPPSGITADQLAELVHQLRHLPTADDIADAIRAALLTRIPDLSRHDDVALLVIRVP
jgi:serine phosphatase RsbU (regulator of sigma subunit)